MIYQSKVDWWIALILVLLPCSLFIVSIWLIFSGETLGGLINLSALCVVALVYVFGLFPLRYETTSDVLVVRSGWGTRRVPYGEIRNVSPSRSPLSSPALSLDRLRIDYGKIFPLYISPDDRQAFLRDLAARCPHLRLLNGQLEPLE
jgi:membrane protein YdbS with pleckstrin-like domain